MKKLFILLTLALMVFTNSAFAQDENTAWVCPGGFEGQTLHLSNWDDYIAEDTIPNFEALCGVTVEVTIMEVTEDMMEDVRNGTEYDILIIGESTVEQMVDEGLLQPLNYDLIPNSANLAEEFRNQPGEVLHDYAIPYQWLAGGHFLGIRLEK